MESFVQGADTGWVRTGRAIADEAAGKETESERGALLHFMTRLPALLNPKPQVPTTTFGTLSQAALLQLRSFFPAPPSSKAWTSFPSSLRPPSDAALPSSMPGRSLMPPQVRAHTRLDPGLAHLPHPAPHSRPQSSTASTPATTPWSLLLFKVGAGGERRKKKKGNSHQLLVTCKWEKNALTTDWQQAQQLKERKPRGQRGRPCCRRPPWEHCAAAHPVWCGFREQFQPPRLRPSTSFPARGRGFISSHLPTHCLHALPAAPLLQA